MSAIVRAEGLGKRYGRTWALRDCTLDVPAGRVTGLVGPNGAGKSTLLNLIVGVSSPSEGSVQVCGSSPGSSPAQLARVGYVPQDTPAYAHLTVGDHLRLGARLNPRWDPDIAHRRVEALGLPLDRRAGRLSGGQRAQLALTLGLAKQPDLLVLDEPVASLDPLARRDFLQALMGAVADTSVSVLLSSHLVADLERVCDHLVVLVGSQVRLARDVDDLLATHHRLVGPRRSVDDLPRDQRVISARHTDRQTTLVIDTRQPILDPAWTVTDLDLEELVLAYLEVASSTEVRTLEVAR